MALSRRVPSIGRRTLIALAALAPLVAPGSGAGARAEDWPARPVRLIVPFAPGGSTDVVARIVGDQLTRLWGQSVVIDNKPGAGTNVGADAAAKAAPDGYTMFMGAAALATSRNLYRTLPYELSDLAPVSLVCTFPLLVLVPENSPLKTVPDLIAFARTNPGKLSFASPGLGSTPHLAGELFKQMAGIDMTHVPYRGDAPALTDTMAGRVDLQISGPALLDQVKGGKVRGLAVTGAARSPAAPELQAIAETVPGYDVSSWFALFVPAKTPPAIIAKMNADTARVVGEPAVRSRFAAISMVATGSTPQALGALLDAEVKKWAVVIRTANIALEQ
jgi:tripartite-type tricarboxylate transporter receptor subunit TctC